ncbi:hypothetical protein NL676_026988 [Syzygium grande]|nr:hypothetical protein NL676_026988 [Syzygium grande]
MKEAKACGSELEPDPNPNHEGPADQDSASRYASASRAPPHSLIAAGDDERASPDPLSLISPSSFVISGIHQRAVGPGAMEPRDEQVRGCREILEIISLMSFANLSEEQVHKLVTMREIARQVVGGRFQGVSKIDVARALRSTIDDIVVTCKETLDIISRMSHEGLDDHRVQLMSRIEEIAGAIADRKVDAGSAWHYEFAERFNETDDAGISESMMDCAMQTNHEDVHILNMEGQVFVDELMGIAVKNEEFLWVENW